MDMPVWSKFEEDILTGQGDGLQFAGGHIRLFTFVEGYFRILVGQDISLLGTAANPWRGKVGHLSRISILW